MQDAAAAAAAAASSSSMSFIVRLPASLQASAGGGKDATRCKHFSTAGAAALTTDGQWRLVAGIHPHAPRTRHSINEHTHPSQPLGTVRYRTRAVNPSVRVKHLGSDELETGALCWPLRSRTWASNQSTTPLQAGEGVVGPSDQPLASQHHDLCRIPSRIITFCTYTDNGRWWPRAGCWRRGHLLLRRGQGRESRPEP